MSKELNIDIKIDGGRYNSWFEIARRKYLVEFTTDSYVIPSILLIGSWNEGTEEEEIIKAAKEIIYIRYNIYLEDFSFTYEEYNGAFGEDFIV